MARFRAVAEDGRAWDWKAGPYGVGYRHMIEKGGAHFDHPFNGRILRELDVIVRGRIVAAFRRARWRS